MKKSRRKSAPIVSIQETERVVCTGVYQHAEPLPRAQWPPAALAEETASIARLDEWIARHAAGLAKRNRRRKPARKAINQVPARELADIRQFAADRLAPWLRPFVSAANGGLNVDLGDGLQSFAPLPDDAPREAHDALHVLHAIHALTVGNFGAEETLARLLALGQLVERLRVRGVEHYALAGRKSTLGAKKIAAHRQAKAAKARPNYAALVAAEIARQQKAKKHANYEHACEVVAAAHDVAVRTVKRHAPNIWTAGKRGRRRPAK